MKKRHQHGAVTDSMTSCLSQIAILYISMSTLGSFHEIVTLKNGQNEIVFDRLWYPLSILLLAAIGAKLIGPHGGLQVDKQKVCQVTGSVESPSCVLFQHVCLLE